MKNFRSLVLLFTAATWAAPLERDGDCEMEWVTVFTAATTTSTIPTSSSIALAGGEEKTALGQARSSSSAVLTSASSTPSMTVAPVDSTDSPSPDTKGTVTTNDAGEAGIPIDGPHLSAPASNVAVPVDAKTYTPPSKVISGKALETWMREQTKLKPASKWLKIAPGVYNIDCKDNIVFSFMDGLTEKWTIDMRGVTFLVAGTCQAIYINQCEDFTIYGGTLWFDAGEVWTQAKVTSIEGGTVTCVVDEGYDLATWRKAGPRNLNAMDSSDPNHFVRPKGLNYWFASDFNFDSLDSERTWTMHVGTKEVPLQGE